MAIWVAITVAAALAFGLIGRRLAGRRKRHIFGWGLAAAIFPPALFVLMALPTREAAEG